MFLNSLQCKVKFGKQSHVHTVHTFRCLRMTAPVKRFNTIDDSNGATDQLMVAVVALPCLTAKELLPDQLCNLVFTVHQRGSSTNAT